MFFNAELVEGCEKLGVKASPVGFVDDVNILTYEKSTANICETLSRVHEVCTQWARTHGASFAPDKYELIYFTRTPRKFDITVNIRINNNVIILKTDIRVLGVQIDLKLR